MSARAVRCLLLTLFVFSCGTQSEVITTDADVRDVEVGEVAGSDVVFAADIPVRGTDGWTKEQIAWPEDVIDETMDSFLGPQCEEGEGCFLDPCTSNSDCLTGYCVGHMGDMVCSMACEEECPLGFTCAQVAAGGPDTLWICVSDHTSLCRPCGSESDCQSAFGVQDHCISYGEEGFFCASSCGNDKECPAGFSCEDPETIDGLIVPSHCVAAAATCPCTATSIANSLWTPCSQSNELGTCPGKRVCQEAGLTDCDAPDPDVDLCNGSDDDCDGAIDEDTCDDDNQCTDDACLGADGCQNLPNNDTCEDGDACTFGDKCVDGFCVPGVNPLFEMCNGLDDDCDGDIDEGFDLGVPCTVGVGTCQAEGVTQCASEGFVTECSVQPGSPIVELCNELDDDCDGIVDEDFVLGAPCTVGVGVCEGAGLVACAPDGAATCNAEEGMPSPEICDGLDNDCDGAVDDLDSDECQLQNAWGSCQGTLFCLAGGASICLGTYATAEACNGLDDDCDGAVDETFDVGAACDAGIGQCQVDGVKVCTEEGISTQCSGEELPPQEEACNGVDDDCDGDVDEPDALECEPYYIDIDEDGFGDIEDVQCLCEAEYPYTAAATGDCADKDASVNPSVIESCNGKDDNCDGTVDEEAALGCVLFYVDGDKDGYGEQDDWKCLCGPDGQYNLIFGGDCNDADPTVKPGVTELCNGQDDDCDGNLDEGYVTGIPCTVGIGACAKQGTVICSLDGKQVTCSEIAGEPAEEKCNGIDDNCNGSVDEGFPGVGVPCEAGIGDCKQSGLLVCTFDGAGLECGAVPGVPGNELCGGGDENCDGEVDEAYAGGCTPYFKDEDDDGHGVADDKKCVCLPTYPYTADMVGDCDDNNKNAHPGGVETCGNGDEDCDGDVDEEGAAGCQQYYIDVDGDGFGADGDTKCLCAPQPPYTVTKGGDCDDAQMVINPAATEVCGGGDEDCDGAVDEYGAQGCVTAYLDEDGDGHGTKSEVCSCKIGEGYVGYIFDDCDDFNDQVFVGAAEFCNGIDDDCDGNVDDGYDLQGDPAHCGECNAPCPQPGPLGLAQACVDGTCVVKECPDGTFDLDLDPANGCEVTGEIIYVDDSNNTGIENGTQAHPFKAINLALFYAEPQTVVHVYNGTYNEKLVVEIKNITIRGESRTGVIVNQQEPLFPTVETKADNFTLRNLTVKGNHFGIKLSGTRQCTLRDLDVTGSGVGAPDKVAAVGVQLVDAQSNNLVGLKVSGFKGGQAAWGIGIEFDNSIHNNLADNAMSNIYGADANDPSAGAVALFINADSWDNEVKLSNTAEGSPIPYLFRQHGVAVTGLALNKSLAPTNLGKIVAVESEGIVIKDNQIANYKGFSPNSEGANAAPGYGIRVLSCPGVQVVGNTVDGIWGGVGGEKKKDEYGSTAGAGGVAYGILVETSPSALISGNEVSQLVGGKGGDTASHFGKGGSGGGTVGIRLSGSALAELADNQVEAATGGDGGNRNGAHGYGGAGGSTTGYELTGCSGAKVTGNLAASFIAGDVGKHGNYSNDQKKGGAARGFVFSSSSGLVVTGNSVSDLTSGKGVGDAHPVGFAFSSAAQATLDSNIVSGLVGIQPGSSSAVGFQLGSSSGCILKANQASDFTVGTSTSLYFMTVDKASESAQVSMDNMGQGDPIVFLYDGKEGTVISDLVLDSPMLPSNYGRVALLTSTGVTLRDVEVRDFQGSSSVVGVRVGNCHDCTVERILLHNISGGNPVGLHVSTSTNLKVANVTVSSLGNANATASAGVYIAADSTATIDSTIFSDVRGDCLHNAGAADHATMRYTALFGCTQSTVFNNNAVTHKLLYLGPQFIDQAGGDLHLKPGSPCIDGGHPDADYCGEPAPNGCRVNMGAYGSGPFAASKPGAENCNCP